MARTGRATVMVGERFEIREYPVPDPEPGTVLLRQELGGICGTDLHNWEFQRMEFDVIPGHENVGVIDSLGEGAETDSLGNPVEVGDRVVLSPAAGYGFSPSEEQPYLRGGFAEYIYLWDPETLFIKTDLPAEIAVLSEPASCAAHCVSRGKIQFGDTVVIQGTGPIGLLALNWARVSGAGRLIVVGGPPGRLEMAERLGADVTIDIAEIPDPEERKKIVREIHLRTREPTSCTNVRDSPPLFPKDWILSATAARTWNMATSWMSERSSATPTRCSCARTCDWKPAGVSDRTTSSERCRCSKNTNLSLPISSATFFHWRMSLKDSMPCTPATTLTAETPSNRCQRRFSLIGDTISLHQPLKAHES